jgi:hypothetical protein
LLHKFYWLSTNIFHHKILDPYEKTKRRLKVLGKDYRYQFDYDVYGNAEMSGLMIGMVDTANDIGYSGVFVC